MLRRRCDRARCTGSPARDPSAHDSNPMIFPCGPNRARQSALLRNDHHGRMSMPIILWLLGVPLSVIIVLALLHVF
jgi:hypothetical protein